MSPGPYKYSPSLASTLPPSFGAGREGLLEAGPAIRGRDGDVIGARKWGEDGAVGLMKGPAAAVADEGAEAAADAGQAGGISEWKGEGGGRRFAILKVGDDKGEEGCMKRQAGCEGSAMLVPQQREGGKSRRAG